MKANEVMMVDKIAAITSQARDRASFARVKSAEPPPRAEVRQQEQ